ncbi:MAG: class I SAM-dependent methyltransferase [Patescibacteria group bacterium]
MADKAFDYEEMFMGVRKEKPKTYFRSFKQDYRLRSLVRTIKLNKGKLLDIGCGGGMLTESLPYYFPKASIFGCDISKSAIKYAAKFGSGKVKYNQIQNNRFPYKNNFFDVCICLDVFEHIPDADFFLSEVKRVLKKSGSFFLIVPCEGERFTYTWFFQKTHLGEDLTFRYLGHIHPEFTHKRVIALLQKYGFSIQEKAYSEHIFYQLIQFIVLFLPKILLEIFLGKNKANEYTNSSLVKAPKNNNDYLLKVRNLWYKVWDFMMFYPMNWETLLLRRVPVTAWKLHVLSEKK